MKYLIGLTLWLGLSASISSGFNLGRPQCRTPADFGRGFSMKNEPRFFWECLAFAQPVLRECESGTEFSETYLMCTVPGAVLGSVDIPSALECGCGLEVDLSTSVPVCVPFDCETGILIYNPEGKPTCHRFDEEKAIDICPGADPQFITRGIESCDMPKCTLTEYMANKLWPSRNPQQFYKCAHVSSVVSFNCSPGTCFDASIQTCVYPQQWRNTCA